ncbi:hypothetical protein ACFO0N_01080 [Halobium salinum]|uniref:Uncharacterized protein n=1 Tax=Halobium salinum TaxID=1364940 RepID=A0ABD5P6T7_9EURY|nr:hypothetical protein [Halobium salinum]
MAQSATRGGYIHSIGGNNGRVSPPENGDGLGELRRLLEFLHVGDRVVFAGEKDTVHKPVTVVSIVEEEGERQITLRGEQDGYYAIRYSSEGRPSLRYINPKNGEASCHCGKFLYTLFFVAGETGPEIR